LKSFSKVMDKHKKILFNAGVIIILFVFGFSLFKNISYPLLWNDEASTAMFGKRVLEYGYPKAHDGKNFLYFFRDINHDIGIRSNGDVYIAEGWTQYYLAAIGEYFAQQTDDIYTKTRIMRTPFALAGFLAIIIFGLTVSLFFKGNRKKAFIVFFLFELASVSLVLHLKEVRYYSLILLFSAILINVYLRYSILKTLSYKYYVWIVPLFIVLLFYTHYPIAVIFLTAFGLHSLVSSYLVYRRKFSIFIRDFFKSILPLLIPLIFIIPSLIYFKTFAMVNMLTLESNLGFGNYVSNTLHNLSFFTKFEFLCLAILLKILLISFLCYWKRIILPADKILLKSSNFLTLFFGVYLFVIARVVFPFERYVIVLQPVLVCIILLDILLCWRMRPRTFMGESYSKETAFKIFIVAILMVTYVNITPQMGLIIGHLYELTHRYEGPLDFAIPYIQEKYDDPSELIIATNYEENAYMYYLDSKTIIGYVGNNLDEDMELEPDIIINRRYFNSVEYRNIFDVFFGKNEYQEIIFPIYDYAFNNIPELDFRFPHFFETKFTINDSEKLSIYLKQ